jgi:hypothetical protein
VSAFLTVITAFTGGWKRKQPKNQMKKIRENNESSLAEISE